jgi:pilus assembly protein Flp/PilA
LNRAAEKESKMAFRNVLGDESGQGMVEYGLILALVSLVAIGAIILIGPKVNALYEKANTELDNTIQ